MVDIETMKKIREAGTDAEAQKIYDEAHKISEEERQAIMDTGKNVLGTLGDFATNMLNSKAITEVDMIEDVRDMQLEYIAIRVEAICKKLEIETDGQEI